MADRNQPWLPAFRLVAWVALLVLVAGKANARQAASTCEERLFERLVRHVDGEELPVLTVSFGESLVYEVRSRDGEALSLHLRGSGAVKAPPITWHWGEIPIRRRIDLLERLALTPQLRIDLASFCFDHRLDDEAHAHLHRAAVEDTATKAAVDRALSDRLPGGAANAEFEWLIDRYVLPEEKKSILIRNAEAWLMARKAAEDEKYERTDGIFRKAHWLQAKGFFEMARGMFRKVARVSPDTDIGRESAEKVDDNSFLILQPVVENGPTENRVDIVILGDGYQLDDRHQGSFRRACEQLVDYLAQREVIEEYASYFNFYRMHTSSKESGVDNHTQDFSTALGGKWSGASQGQVTVDHGLVRGMLERHEIEWDNAMVMVKRGGLGTGGGRISAFAHASTGTAYHELGHSFAGLLDEYSTQVSDTPTLGGAPRGWNIANSPEVEQCPWKHWIEAKTQGVGLFRGGAAGAAGAFRPTDSGCLMNSGTELCVVCREQFVRTIYAHVRPIEAVTPEPGTILVKKGAKQTFELEVMKPASRYLEVTWLYNGRPIKGGERSVKDGVVKESLTLALDELEIATGYRGALSAVVRDTTAWVLLDERGRLQQRVTWILDRPDPKKSERTTPGARGGGR